MSIITVCLCVMWTVNVYITLTVTICAMSTITVICSVINATCCAIVAALSNATKHTVTFDNFMTIRKTYIGIQQNTQCWMALFCVGYKLSITKCTIWLFCHSAALFFGARHLESLSVLFVISLLGGHCWWFWEYNLVMCDVFLCILRIAIIAGKTITITIINM